MEIGVILAGAVVVETLVKYFKEAARDKTLFATMSLGILIAYAMNLKAFTTMGIMVRHEAIDFILTGLLISRGSNVASDLFKIIRNMKIIKAADAILMEDAATPPSIEAGIERIEEQE